MFRPSERLETPADVPPPDFRRILDQMPEAVCLCQDGVVLYANGQAARLLGLPAPAALVGRRLPDLVARPSEAAMAALIDAALSDPGMTVEERITTAGGRPVCLEVQARPLRLDVGPAFCLVLRDVSDRRAYEEQLKRQAFLDPLTGLANRTLFMVRLEHAIQRADRHRRGLAVMFIDLDDFKRINDTLGHDSGDVVLVEAARRLRAALRQEDTLARRGGDEFTALLEGVADTGDAAGVADRIRRRLREPIAVGRQQVSVTCSIGIALRRPGGPGAAALLRQADIAMYRAKRGGKARWAVFWPAGGADARQRQGRAGLSRPLPHPG